MKVAIIGAGLSGLACAFELEKHGVMPTIFEKKSQVGDALCQACLNLRLLNRSITDPFKYMSRRYNLSLFPLSQIKRVDIHSPAKTLTAIGKLGYIVKRGTEKDSLENQIAAKVKSPIKFNSYIEILDIRDKFDHIVIATGNNVIAKELGVWTDTFIAQVRYGTIIGDFKTDATEIWFNTKYAKNGFCYFIPESRKQASLVQIVNGITNLELDFYWRKFLSSENINYEILETRDVEHTCGIVRPVKVNNIYFVGNTAGFTDDYIGIGAVNAIESGILAASSIVNNTNYNNLVEPIIKHIIALHEYRKALNLLDNQNIDSIVTLLNLPVVKQLIYNNPLFKLPKASLIPKAYCKLNKE